MFLRFEVSFDLFTHINRLDDGINLSTEIAELVPYRICRFLVFERYHNSDGGILFIGYLLF